MPQKKKRKYTFRKGQLIPYESGSLVHKIQKSERETAKRFERVIGTNKKKKK
jgi:hypothetical protein